MKLPKFTGSIETRRCILKIPQESEAQDLWNLITEDITKYMTWSKGPDKTATLKNIRKAMKNAKERTSWDAGIYNKTTGVLLGRCGIYKKDIEVPSFSIGYWLGNSYWGEGIIPECVQALTKYAFETGGVGEMNYSMG